MDTHRHAALLLLEDLHLGPTQTLSTRQFTATNAAVVRLNPRRSNVSGSRGVIENDSGILAAMFLKLQGTKLNETVFIKGALAEDLLQSLLKIPQLLISLYPPLHLKSNLRICFLAT